jgi:tetratricopeptide (TPR) repeat protein
VFSTADSKKISDEYVAVRLLGGNDLDDEGRAFMKRFGVRGYPTLLAMTADGAVLSTSFQRDTAGILSTMEGAAKAETEFRAKAKELGASKLPENLRTMAGLYKSRKQFDQARANYETLTAKNPQVDDQIALLEILAAEGDNPAHKALLGTLIETRKDHAKHINWRLELATADLPTQIRSREEFMAMQKARKTALEALLPTVTKASDEAVVRNELATSLSRLQDSEGASKHWDWILANAKGSDAVPGALMGKALMAINGGYMTSDIAKVKEGRALLQKVIDDHGSHKAAGQARRFIGQADQLITQLEAKAKAKAADSAPADGDK